LDEIPPSPFPDYFLRLAGTDVWSAEGITPKTIYVQQGTTILIFLTKWSLSEIDVKSKNEI
jgi:hypothetical protein